MTLYQPESILADGKCTSSNQRGVLEDETWEEGDRGVFRGFSYSIKRIQDRLSLFLLLDTID